MRATTRTHGNARARAPQLPDPADRGSARSCRCDGARRHGRLPRALRRGAGRRADVVRRLLRRPGCCLSGLRARGARHRPRRRRPAALVPAFDAHGRRRLRRLRRDACGRRVLGRLLDLPPLGPAPPRGGRARPCARRARVCGACPGRDDLRGRPPLRDRRPRAAHDDVPVAGGRPGLSRCALAQLAEAGERYTHPPRDAGPVREWFSHLVLGICKLRSLLTRPTSTASASPASASTGSATSRASGRR